MKAKPFVLLALVFLLQVLIACGGSVDETTTSSLPTNPPNKVEVNYFYESDACFCLGLASEWINTTITTDYKTELDSGKLVYNRYDTKDPVNSAIMAEFKATSFALFITTIRGEERSTWPVGKIWMYTDPTGENEVVKSKFINVLKDQLDRALAGG